MKMLNLKHYHTEQIQMVQTQMHVAHLASTIVFHIHDLLKVIQRLGVSSVAYERYIFLETGGLDSHCWELYEYLRVIIPPLWCGTVSKEYVGFAIQCFPCCYVEIFAEILYLLKYRNVEGFVNAFTNKIVLHISCKWDKVSLLNLALTLRFSIIIITLCFLVCYYFM